MHILFHVTKKHMHVRIFAEFKGHFTSPENTSNLLVSQQQNQFTYTQNSLSPNYSQLGLGNIPIF